MRKSKRKERWYDPTKEIPKLFLLPTVIISICYLFFYDEILSLFFEILFPNNYFIYSKNEFDSFLILPFLWIGIMLWDFPENKKTNKKKVAISLILITILVFLIIIGLDSNVLVFSSNSICETNILTGDTVTYNYDDIQYIELSYARRVSKFSLGKDVSPVYNIFLKDGKQLYIYIEKAIFLDENNIFVFDKKIAAKRIIVGDFISTSNNNPLSSYYEKIFRQSGDG